MPIYAPIGGFDQNAMIALGYPLRSQHTYIIEMCPSVDEIVEALDKVPTAFGSDRPRDWRRRRGALASQLEFRA